MTYKNPKKEIDTQIKLARKYDLSPDYIETLEVASEALGRQIPQKAIEEISEIEGVLYICQSCRGFVGYLYDYCQNCGQALDWSEE